MANIYTSVEQLIGKTPLVELTNIEKKYDLKAKLLAKVELFNPWLRFLFPQHHLT